MKTKFSFSKKSRTSLLVATATLLLLSMQSAIFAGSGTWLSSPVDGNWNNMMNWSSGTVPNASSDTATFATSNTTGVGIAANTEVNGITFNLGASPFTITVAPTVTLTISGTGITNNSVTTQNFVTAVNGAGDRGLITFTNSATAGTGTVFSNTGSEFSGVNGGITQFLDTSDAGSATINNNGGTVSSAGGGFTAFRAGSTAGSATINNNAGTVSGAGGGFTQFVGTSTAGSATLKATGGTGAGGSIQFLTASTGGTASVDVERNGPGTPGNLDISAHTGGVTIGSLEDGGNPGGDVFLGANNLTVGSNNLSKAFSGQIQDGPFLFGSLTKIGTGTFTLSGPNSYKGGTTVNAGSLFVNNTIPGSSGTGSGSVTVNSGATLGGSGRIGFNAQATGAVTVNSGATLAPGPTGNGSTGILQTGALTLASGSNFSVDLKGDVAGTSYDQVVMGDTSAPPMGTGGVFITGSNLLINTALNLAVGEHLFIVENNGPNAVTGTFTFNGLPLAEGATFTADGDTFTISYIGNGGAAPLGPAVGNDIELSVVSTAVPEPTTWIGGALGFPFIVFVYLQRRRRAQMLRRA